MAQRNRATAYNRGATSMDALALLTADHRTVEDLFAQYQDAGDFPTRQRIAARVFSELALHAQLEETIFYPAFAEQAGKKGTQLVADSHLEHQKVQDLIIEMQLPGITDEAFEAKFHALMYEVQHHVEQEENEMFPEAEQILADRLESLRHEMVEFKQQHMTTPKYSEVTGKQPSEGSASRENP
jgi:hemerythrin superfamily protein